MYYFSAIINICQPATDHFPLSLHPDFIHHEKDETTTLSSPRCAPWHDHRRHDSCQHPRFNKIFIAASLCLLTGLLQYGCPINKKIWSPTFVLTTCGFAATTLALLTWHIDARGNRRGTHVWNVIGVNPLFCYVLSNLLPVFADTVPFGGNNLHHRVYHVMTAIVGDGCFCSCLYALLIIALTWCIGNILYRKKIYIKL